MGVARQNRMRPYADLLAYRVDVFLHLRAVAMSPDRGIDGMVVGDDQRALVMLGLNAGERGPQVVKLIVWHFGKFAILGTDDARVFERVAVKTKYL